MRKGIEVNGRVLNDLNDLKLRLKRFLTGQVEGLKKLKFEDARWLFIRAQD